MTDDSTKAALDERAVLKPCPFCGGRRLSGARNETGSMVTVCDTCEAMGPSQVGTSLAAICAAWNTRAAPQVRPLVWQNNGNHWAGGHGYVVRKFGVEYTLTIRNQFDQYFFDLESAQAAAQADYTRRILDALA